MALDFSGKVVIVALLRLIELLRCVIITAEEPADEEAREPLSSPCTSCIARSPGAIPVPSQA